MIQRTKSSKNKNSSKSNSVFLTDAFFEYNSSAEMKLDLSLSPTYKGFRDSEDVTNTSNHENFNSNNFNNFNNCLNADVTSMPSRNPLDSLNLKPRVRPISISPKVQPQTFTSSPIYDNDDDSKPSSLNSLTSENLNSSMSPMSIISSTISTKSRAKHKSSYSETSSITLVEHTNDHTDDLGTFYEDPKTESVSCW